MLCHTQYGQASLEPPPSTKIAERRKHDSMWLHDHGAPPVAVLCCWSTRIEKRKRPVHTSLSKASAFHLLLSPKKLHALLFKYPSIEKQDIQGLQSLDCPPLPDYIIPSCHTTVLDLLLLSIPNTSIQVDSAVRVYPVPETNLLLLPSLYLLPSPCRALITSLPTISTIRVFTELLHPRRLPLSSPTNPPSLLNPFPLVV